MAVLLLKNGDRRTAQTLKFSANCEQIIFGWAPPWNVKGSASLLAEARPIEPPEPGSRRNLMAQEYVDALKRSRTKLVEQRRALVKRDCCSDRNEGYAERIIAIQNALEATDR